MAFDEVRLPEDIERGAEGGPRFKTNILTLNSGFERRAQVWQFARGQWDIGYGVTSRVNFVEVLKFFYARRGQARGFRFKDWSDYELTQEAIANGDGSETDFQVTKTYTDGTISYSRTIKKLASISEVRVNGAVQTLTTDYTVDLNTGIISFVSPPGDTLAIDVTGEFDVPVRFDTDDFNLSLEQYDAGAVPNLPIVELRV